MIVLSKRETEIIANLEFEKKYFFAKSDIEKYFENQKQMSNTIHLLLKKKRIIKLNRYKYYLIPIRARKGTWSVHPFIIIDEMMDGKEYFIGGWAAANYWQLTDQIPMKYEVYTNRRQGEVKALDTSIIFKRIRKESLKKVVTQEIKDHDFKILSKEETKKWLKSRN